jgi:hypothetical protein
MPIVMVRTTGTWVLQCVNHHEIEGPEPTTMKAIDGWVAMVFTPTPPEDGPELPRQYLPFRGYACQVCGYFEMYMPGGAMRLGEPVG